MRKTLHRQHADLRDAYRQASEAFLNRVQIGASSDELAEAVGWMEADSAALLQWEQQHPGF